MSSRIALFLAALLTSSAAFAQDPALLGLPVTAVHIEIEGRRESAPDLMALIETHIGAPLDAAQARESLAQLSSAGRFEDVRVDGVREGAGVALIYRLTPRHPVRRVRVQGDTGIEEALLRDALETRFEGLASAPSEADATAAVLLILRDEGFLHARATMRADVTHAPHETSLTFDVEAGPAAPIATARIDGEWPGGHDALLDRLAARAGEPYRRSVLRAALERLVADMRATGRYGATASHTARPAASGDGIDLVIDADAGPIVEVRFEGDAMPRDRLDALVPIARERAVDIDLLEDATVRIVNDLRGEGHWRANAIYRTAEADGRLIVTFTITRGPRFRLGALAIEGNRAVSAEALASFVDLEPGDVFLETALARGALAIREYYRRAGFASADVKLDVTDMPRDAEGPDARMAARLIVIEGPQSFVRTVTFTGVAAVGEADLRRRMQSRAGDPYYVPYLSTDRDAIVRAYLDRGYQQASAAIEPAFDQAGTGVALTVAVNEGPQTTVDRIIVVGNVRTDLQTILDEITLRQGSPVGLSDILDSQRRLSALGLFRRVRIAEAPRQPGSATVDLIVTLEEAPATAIGYGGGIEMVERSRRTSPDTREDQLEFVPRGFFEITRRNIGGGNRAVSLFTRLSFGPENAPEDHTRDGKGFGLAEYRAVGSYRESRAFRFDADLVVSAGLERAIRTSFSFDRQSLSADVLKRLSPAVRASARYAVEYTTLVDQGIKEEDQLPIDRLFPQVRLSIVSGSILRDTRSDPVDPERGAMMAVDVDLAPRALGSQVGFVKTFGQAIFFRRLPTATRIVFAGGARLGLARGFSRVVDQTVELSASPIEVRDIPASQRFFAGGSTTVRGFQLDRLGVPEILDPDGLSNGGNAMLVMNAELRLPVWKDLGAVTFVDAGNVFARVSDFDITELRPTAGVGLRYRSPIGPLRLDVGFKLNRETFPNRREHDSEWHFSLGHAF
ncbi:MAG: POTRA domain-containing protein [Vicinamibacterales bacterium]